MHSTGKVISLLIVTLVLLTGCTKKISDHQPAPQVDRMSDKADGNGY